VARLIFFLALLLTGIQHGHFFQAAAPSQAAGREIFVEFPGELPQDYGRWLAAR
jgi:hypothetical protein